MERDFMGLNSKDSVVLVKEEAIEGGQEEDGFEAFNNRSASEIQKSSNHNRRGRTHASMVAPVELTIFYGGMVNVYNDISPEKAQAILLLAENGARVHNPRTATRDAVHVSRPMNPPLLSSHAANGGLSMAKDAPIRLSSPGQVMQSAVPQSRQASLARFLEKRRERVMASAPYTLGKRSMDSTNNPGSSENVRQ